MKILALEIPDDTKLLAKWLEGQIIGMDLGDLVAQLLVGETRQASPVRETLFNDCLEQILSTGLGTCSEQQLQTLLDHPKLLLELQEKVFVDGGQYWSSIAVTDEHQASAKRIIQAAKSTPSEPVSVVQTQNKITRHQITRRWALYATAACLLIGLGIWSLKPSPPTGWGFDRPGLLAQQMTASDYLETLAEAANDWFNKRPKDEVQLASRLRTFRAGCETLLAADHPQLADADKNWLLERCRTWRDKIDQQLANMESAQTNFSDASQSADILIRNMVDALRKQAKLVDA